MSESPLYCENCGKAIFWDKLDWYHVVGGVSACDKNVFGFGWALPLPWGSMWISDEEMR